MTLRKQLTIALLCTSMSPSICIGMDGFKDEKNRNTTVSQQNIEMCYNEAIVHLNSYLANKPSANLLAEAVGKLEFAAKQGHSSSSTLLELVTSVLPRPSNEPKITPERAGTFAQLHCILGNYDSGFNCLIPLLKENYQGIGSYLNKILVNDETISYFFTKLTTLEKDDSLSVKDRTQITQTFLDSFIFNDLYYTEALEFKPHTQRNIGSAYLNAYMNPLTDLEGLITIIHKKIDGVMQRKQTYLSVALKYSILAAKQGNQEAYVTLLNALKSTAAYDVYYKYLLPFFHAGDAQVPSLFNRVASDDPQALQYFANYASNLVKNKLSSIESRTAERILSNFKLYSERMSVELRGKKKEESALNSTVSLSHHKDWFEGETPIVGKFAGNTPENLLSREEKAENEFKAGMEMLANAPHDALGRLREAEKLGHKGAINELNKIRQSLGYKNPQKTNNKNNLGKLLRAFEPTLEEQFNMVVSNLNANPEHSIDFLWQLSKNKKALDSLRRKANQELDKIKRTKSYKKPETVKPDFHSSDIGYLLWHKENPNNSTNSSPIKEETAKETSNLLGEFGIPAANYQKAIAYFKGIGVKQNQEEGFKWLKKAADGGNIDAKRLIECKENPTLFQMMLEVTESVNNIQNKIIHDPNALDAACAVISSPKAHDLVGHFQTNPRALDALTSILDSTQTDQQATPPRDIDQNSKPISDPRSPAALMSLDDKYLMTNAEEAFKYYKIAADDKGHAEAQFTVARMYAIGDGTKEDPERAFYYYKLAADQEHKTSQAIVSEMYQNGEGVKKDSKMALRYAMLAKGLVPTQENVEKLTSAHQKKVSPPSKEKQTRKKPLLLSSAQQKLESKQEPSDSSPHTIPPQSVIPPVAAPKIEETPPQLTLKKREEKKAKVSTPVTNSQLPDQSQEEANDPIFQMNNAQLPDQSQEEAPPPAESSISPANKINKTIRRTQYKKTHSLSNLHTPSLECTKEASASEEEPFSKETTSNENKLPRRTLKRTQSLISALPSNKTL